MIKMKVELAALETETFEIEEIADLDSPFASAEVPIGDPGAAPCSCMCSTGCLHWTSSSTSCSSTS
ncbi:hypothetical protein [Acrocarpospora sp. B8E8]|uniref:hypothetical protein n=1 Tax=Acrocarpospora sp. B8E8 TaxID=3153572 RepID=UPI00325F758F